VIRSPFVGLTSGDPAGLMPNGSWARTDVAAWLLEAAAYLAVAGQR
jgi:hypothetical protein